MSTNGFLNHWREATGAWRKSNAIDDQFAIGRIENLKLTTGDVYVSIPRFEFNWLVEQAKQNIHKSMADSQFIRSYLSAINPGDLLQINPSTGPRILIEGRGSLYWEGIESNHQHRDRKA